MAVRNFWADLDVDGYQNMVGGGPRRKDGGMEVTVYQREDGRIETACRVICRSYGNTLTTEVYVRGKQVGEFVTER